MLRFFKSINKFLLLSACASLSSIVLANSDCDNLIGATWEGTTDTHVCRFDAWGATSKDQSNIFHLSLVTSNGEPAMCNHGTAHWPRMTLSCVNGVISSDIYQGTIHGRFMELRSPEGFNIWLRRDN